MALQSAASAESLGLMAISYATKSGVLVSPATKKRLLPELDVPSPPSPPQMIDLTALDSDGGEGNKYNDAGDADASGSGAAPLTEGTPEADNEAENAADGEDFLDNDDED